MLRVLSLVVLLFSCVSCLQQKGREKFVKENTFDSIPEYWISQIEKFSIPFSREMPDSNALFFCDLEVFDTSFLVHFRKENNTVNGVFYEVLPAYHLGVENFADEKDQLLFFEGYSFKIDTSRWANIVKQANVLLKLEKDTGQKYRGCFDCAPDFLMHDSKMAVVFGKHRENFERFGQYLKDSLLNQYITKRQPVLHK